MIATLLCSSTSVVMVALPKQDVMLAHATEIENNLESLLRGDAPFQDRAIPSRTVPSLDVLEFGVR
jgi:hypothetical protein